MAKGTIKSFDEEEGKGYIQPDAGGDEVPFDLDAVRDYHQGDVIQEGDPVTYEVEGGMAGTVAKEVRRIGPRGYQ